MCAPALAQAQQTITYEQILADPDNPELSFSYARQTAAAGDLEKTAASLERVLLLKPNWDAARLFYALVLYRLDDLDGAKTELEILKGRPLSTRQAAEVNRYLGRVSSQAKRTRLTGNVGVGFRVDSNPDLTTNSNAGLIGDASVPLNSDERVDGAFIAAGKVRLEHSLGNGSGDILFAEVNGRWNKQFTVDEADYAQGRIRAGGSFYFKDLKLTPYGTASALGLETDLYRTDLGGGLEARYRINPKFALLAAVEGVYQDYNDTGNGSPGSARDGWLSMGAVGLAVRTSDKNTLTIRARQFLKDANSNSFSYDATEVSIRDLLLLGKGQYLSALASYRFLAYDAPDARYSTTISREDDLFRARLAYGLPLRTLFGVVGVDLENSLGDINFQVAGNYYDQSSNISNFDATSISSDVMLIKSFAY
ncbi:MAG: hypothetical protein ABJN26_24020 [Stappiaceae bacterium]